MVRMRRRQRGQSLAEFALITPVLLMLVVTVADFGRVFATSVEVEAAARDAAEFAANDYVSNPPPGDGSVPLSAPAPMGDPDYYDALHLKAAKVVCKELRDLPNTIYQSSDDSCQEMPIILVCVHDSADPHCAVQPFNGSPTYPNDCTDFVPPPHTDQVDSGGTDERPRRWVEVKVCYHFTSLTQIPWLPWTDLWVQRTRQFDIPCYFAPGTTDCG